jgi:hypothetical protein
MLSIQPNLKRDVTRGVYRDVKHPLKGSAAVRTGTVPVAGVAWAQHTGIEAVEVQIDDGAWLSAELPPQDTTDTWRQWRFAWDATSGEHRIAVRATDRDGVVQTPDLAEPYASLARDSAP